MLAVSSDPDFSFSCLVYDCVDHEEILDPLDAYDLNDPNDSPSSASTMPHPTPPHSPKLRTFDTLPLPMTLNPLNPQNHQKKQSHMNCKKQWAKQCESNKPYNYQAWANTKHKHQTQPEEIQTAYTTQKAPAASSGYIVGPNSWYGFDYKPWSRREAIPVTNNEGHVITVLAGQSKDPNWESVHTSASDLLDQSRGKCIFSRKQQKHRCSCYLALSVGI
ncbi:hypothetical protein IW262DRAFT_1467862 [Armillaria fumosa]|nr:hypothetical protein IW262DRAFT_1467862 [Armillaria fumosa]